MCAQSTPPCGSKPRTAVFGAVYRPRATRDFASHDSVPSVQAVNATKVRFTLDDTVFLIDRFTFDVLRGDVRHPDGSDPDYSTIGQCRHSRLSQFAEVFSLVKAFRAWSRHCSERSSSNHSLCRLSFHGLPLMFSSTFDDFEDEERRDEEGGWSDSETDFSSSRASTAPSSAPASRPSSASSFAMNSQGSSVPISVTACRPASMPCSLAHVDTVSISGPVSVPQTSSVPSSPAQNNSAVNHWVPSTSETDDPGGVLLEVLYRACDDVASGKVLSWTHFSQHVPASGTWPLGHSAATTGSLSRTAESAKS